MSRETLKDETAEMTPDDASKRVSVPILMADDDPDDRMLVREALEECRIVNELRFVENGEELMDYLNRRGPWSRPEDSPRPGLILLDLNMPRKNGQEALKEIKEDPHLSSIPVVVLTTSHSEEDISRSYELGANSYIPKPVSFEELVEVVRGLNQYWFDIVSIPSPA